MALNKSSFKNGLRSGMEPKIQQQSKIAFKKAMEKFYEESKNSKTGNNYIEVFDRAVTAASEIFSDEMKKLADDLSITISDEVDSYIKSASIITPPGQSINVNSEGTGSTISSSSPAKIS
jgi:hypothetical protein